MKKVTVSILILVMTFSLSGCFGGSSGGSKDKEEVFSQESQELFGLTLDLSRRYAYLHYETENILTAPEFYGGYEIWQDELDKIIKQWEELEKDTAVLEQSAKKYSKKINFLASTPYASAMTTKEINDIFDKAPAGKKIRTLAKHLGVDAKRAYKILQQTQNEVEADAWNEAGDAFQKLETSAVVIKDGCKVATFVGGVVLSGGTAGLAAASTATKAAVIVSGADLALEVSEDSANIALGNNNDISEFIGDARKFTEPLASILTISDLHNNPNSGMDKFNAVMIALDQFRSAAQEGKVIGIELSSAKPGEKGKILGSGMTEAEVEEWLNSLGIKRTDEGFYEIMEKISESIEMKEVEESEKGDSLEEEGGGADQSAVEPTNPLDDVATESQDNKVEIPTVYGQDGKVKLRFSSPEESTFSQSQARLWKVEISDFDYQDGRAHYICDFEFYMDGVKYREMLDNRTCGFTSTFIEKKGSLRADVTVKFLKSRAVYNEDGTFKEAVKDVYETIDLSRELTVE